MNLEWRLAATALLAGLLLAVGAGCGGVDAKGSVSPLMLLLGGASQTKTDGGVPGTQAPCTNDVLVVSSN